MPFSHLYTTSCFCTGFQYTLHSLSGIFTETVWTPNQRFDQPSGVLPACSASEDLSLQWEASWNSTPASPAREVHSSHTFLSQSKGQIMVFRRSLLNEASLVTKICKVWNFNLSEANQAVLYIAFALFVISNISWPFKGFGCVLLSRILMTQAEKCAFHANYLFIKDLLLFFFDPL